jgi:hypothetical protein
VIIVFQPVDDSRDAVFDQRHVEVDWQAKPLVFQQAWTKRRMNAENRVNDLLGDGIPGYRSLSFLAKAQRTQSLPHGRLIPPVAWTDDFGSEPTLLRRRSKLVE